MDRLNVGIIGTGWCGGIRAEASAKNGLVDQLHICEIREDRLKEVKSGTVKAELTLIQRVFKTAIKEWGYGILLNPVANIEII